VASIRAVGAGRVRLGRTKAAMMVARAAIPAADSGAARRGAAVGQQRGWVGRTVGAAVGDGGEDGEADGAAHLLGHVDQFTGNAGVLAADPAYGGDGQGDKR